MLIENELAGKSGIETPLQENHQGKPCRNTYTRTQQDSQSLFGYKDAVYLKFQFADLDADLQTSEFEYECKI